MLKNEKFSLLGLLRQIQYAKYINILWLDTFDTNAWINNFYFTQPRCIVS